MGSEKKVTPLPFSRDLGFGVESDDLVSAQAFELARSTSTSHTKEFLGFTALHLKEWFLRYKDPVVGFTADGVGNKVKIAQKVGRWESIGWDAVAMNVNDLIRRGLRPLVFADYLARDRAHEVSDTQILRGIVRACREANVALLAGETATLLGKRQGEYEVVGFSAGIAEREKVIDGTKITQGDLILGLPSAGLHANGFREVLKAVRGIDLSQVYPELGEKPLGEILLKQTKIYVKQVLALLDQDVQISGIAHITGGGIPKKLGWVIPEHLQAVINRVPWRRQQIFSFIQKRGRFSERLMWHTFNLGFGMLLVLPEREANSAQVIFDRMGEESYVIGEVRERKTKEAVFLV